jgi:hypothetical protein
MLEIRQKTLLCQCSNFINASMVGKYIELTKGFHALVDADDFERLNKYKWYATINPDGRPGKNSVMKVYARRTTKRKTSIYMHREILGCRGRHDIGDHINGYDLDNRKENLRITDYSTNVSNKTKVKLTAEIRACYPKNWFD